MVAGPLAADADILALRLAGGDGARQQGLHGRIPLIEIGGQQREAGIAVQAQGELGQVVRANGETVEECEKLFGQVNLTCPWVLK